EELLDRWPLDVLEDQKGSTRHGAPHVEQQHDVWVREVAQDLRLPIELLAKRRGGGDLRLQRLERDDASERLLHGFVDVGKSARAERFDDAIVAESNLTHGARCWSNGKPLITAGFSRPMISSIVGATSQMRPPVRTCASRSASFT